MVMSSACGICGYQRANRSSKLSFPSSTSCNTRIAVRDLAQLWIGADNQTFDTTILRESDMMRVLDVLAKDVGIGAIFSD